MLVPISRTQSWLDQHRDRAEQRGRRGYFDQSVDLGVLSREVGDAAGGWLAAECGVAAVIVVAVEPVGQGGLPVGF